MRERLQKLLSRAGVASRRAAEEMIAAGRVSLNGEIVTEPGTKADLQTDEVKVDGRSLKPSVGTVHLVLFKPRGVIATRSDPEGRPTVMDLLPKIPGLFPVGRLDTTTEGLLLLTNDGNFAERAAHPRYEVPRVYHAKVHRVPGPDTLARLTHGVMVEGQRMVADRVRVLSSGGNAWLEVTLHEGKHHEVRRLLEAVGHPVSKLRRVGFGPVSLKGLAPGQFRSLSRDEVRAMLKGGTGLTRPVASPRAPRPRPSRVVVTPRPTRTDVPTRGTEEVARASGRPTRSATTPQRRTSSPTRSAVSPARRPTGSASRSGSGFTRSSDKPSPPPRRRAPKRG